MNECNKHGQLADDGKCDVCEERGIWEGAPTPHADALTVMESEFVPDGFKHREWPGKLTRAQAIQLINAMTDKDDPYWSNLVDDFYDEATDTMPTIYHIFDALGVTKDDYINATGEANTNWPAGLTSETKSVPTLNVTAIVNTDHVHKVLDELIKCDVYASSFQSLGQYRKALALAFADAVSNNTRFVKNNALMPKELTKDEAITLVALGKFNVGAPVACHHCDNEGLLTDGAECEDCCGTGVLIEHHSIDWMTIQSIYKKAVEILGVKS